MWNRVWYQPISRDRVWLLVRLVLLLLAFDVWLLMLPRAALYGSAGFNVAHFAWLDSIQPLPLPTTYVVLMLLVGALSLAVVMGRSSRIVLSCIAFLYTYGWAMSMLDSYQHHYFLSLALLCFACCDPGPNDAASSDSQPSAVAWPFKLLGAITAIMYSYAALSKLDDGWRLGDSPRKWLGDTVLADWVGGGSQLSWSHVGWIVVAAEILLAAGYLAVVIRGEARGGYDQLWRYACLLLAVGLHLGIAVAGLQVGWFTYYMMILAATYFLPAGPLRAVHRALLWAPRQLQKLGTVSAAPMWRRHSVTPNAGHGVPGPQEKSQLISVTPAFLAILVAAGLAFAACLQASELPGAGMAAVVLAVAIVAVLVSPVFGNTIRACLSWSSRLTIAFAVMAITMLISPMHFDFFLWRAKDLQARGHSQRAIEVLQERDGWMNRVGGKRRGDWEHVLGKSLLQVNSRAEAIDHLRRSTRLDPNSAVTQFDLGNALYRSRQWSEAISAYEAAIALRPGFVDAHANLGVVLSQAGQLDRGVVILQKTVDLDDGCAIAHRQLGQIWLQRQELKQARLSLQAALRHNSTDAQTHYLLGTAYDLGDDLTMAMNHYRRAIKIMPTHLQACYNLGTGHARRGELDVAIRHFERILKVNPGNKLARDAIANVRAAGKKQ